MDKLSLTLDELCKIEAVYEVTEARIAEIVNDIEAWEAVWRGENQLAPTVALGFWGLILEIMAIGYQFDDAAHYAHLAVFAYYPVKGIGDHIYLEAIRLIERHMKDGRKLRMWHARTYGV